MNNQLVKINNTDLQIKEFNGQRVVTFKDIDTLHERVDGTAKRNFNENKKHFIDGEDYFVIAKSLKYENRTLGNQNNEIRGLEIPNRGITVLTESGYLMLVKSFTDDLAWTVQRQLVKSYFRIKTGSYNSKGITKDDVFELIKSLPEDNLKNEVSRMILERFLPVEQRQITPRIDIKDLLNEFLKDESAILRTTEYGLAVDKQKLYDFFSSHGFSRYEVLKELDNANLIFHKEDCRTVQVYYKGYPVRVVIVKE